MNLKVLAWGTLGALALAALIVYLVPRWPRYECTNTRVVHHSAEESSTTVSTLPDGIPIGGGLHVSIDPGHPAFDETVCTAWRRIR